MTYTKSKAQHINEPGKKEVKQNGQNVRETESEV